MFDVIDFSGFNTKFVQLYTNFIASQQQSSVSLVKYQLMDEQMSNRFIHIHFFLQPRERMQKREKARTQFDFDSFCVVLKLKFCMIVCRISFDYENNMFI